MRQVREMTIEEFEKELLEEIDDTFTIQIRGENRKSVITIRTQSGYEFIIKVNTYEEALRLSKTHIAGINRLFSLWKKKNESDEDDV